MTTIIGTNTTPFPASLKHFFKCNERGGSTLTDAVGGVVWDVSSAGGRMLFDQNGSIGTIAPSGVEATTPPSPVNVGGVFHTFAGNNPWMVMYAARYFKDQSISGPGARFALGDVNNLTGLYGTPTGLGLSNNMFHIAAGTSSESGNGWRAVQAVGEILSKNIVTDFYDPAPYDPANIKVGPGWHNTIDETPLSLGQLGLDDAMLYQGLDRSANLRPHDVLVVAVFDPAGTKAMYCYDIDSGVWYFATATQSYDTLTALWTPNPCMRISNLALYGYALFEFESLPATWLGYAQWMARRWKGGDRVIHPAIV